MKRFLELVEEKEKTSKPVVMAFGRMNPPTTGHLKLVDKVKSEAEKRGAKHVVMISHSQDSKKNPLSSAQKIKHLKRYAPGVNFKASSKTHPTIFHAAEQLHKAGHDHLVVVAGSDRVKEYHDKLHQYNGKPNKDGHVPYHFKKIEVVSAGHRDPDAEGAEGMSGTKMREHAKNNDFSSFRQGVPSHVPDHHAKELMRDVRKGMGLNESVNRGMFKAVFVTGGPGSGKDVVLREAIAEAKAVELNSVQALDYLNDKQRLSEKSNDYRREALRNRSPLIINGPADTEEKILHIKEELEELGYETLMVFVDTTNEASKDRNAKLTKMIIESVRQDKWQQAQKNKEVYSNLFENFIHFDNSASLEDIEESITDTYQTINTFIETKTTNDIAYSWLENHNMLNINESIKSLFKETQNVKQTPKFIQKFNEKRQASVGVYRKNSSGERADSPADIKPDNRAGDPSAGDIKWDGNKKRGGYTFRSYTEAKSPTITVRPEPKESNFQQDKDKIKRKKFGDKSISASKLGRPPGIGPEYDTRAGGQGAAAGAGLGNQTYSEDTVTPTASNADVSNFAGLTKGPQPNPLAEKKPFSKFRKVKEAIDDPGVGDSGLGGVLGGASNKEGMDSYKDVNRNIQNDYGLKIKKKKIKGAK
jgi:cytidyltransferase-like protein